MYKIKNNMMSEKERKRPAADGGRDERGRNYLVCTLKYDDMNTGPKL